MSKVLTVAVALCAATALVTPAYAFAGTDSAAPTVSAPTATPNAASAALGVSVDANGWYHYTDTLVGSLGLRDMVTNNVSGTVEAGGGCSFASGPTTVNPGSPDGYSEETAFNPKTCQETVVSGTLSAAGEAKLKALDKSANSAPVTQPATPAAPSSQAAKSKSLTPATNYSETAFEKDSWVDPVDITIVSLAPNISWTANGSIITGESNAYAVPYAFPYDGWSGGGVSFSWGGCVGCANLQLNSSATWTNTDFEAIIVFLFGVAGYALCGFNDDPAVFKLSPYIRAGNNGSFAYGYNQPSSATGGCSDLVHFRENHGYGNGS